MISAHDIYDSIKKELKHFITNGSGFVLEDNDGHIVYIGYAFDHYDKMKLKYSASNEKVKYKTEIVDVAYQSNAAYNKLVQNKPIKYGQVLCIEKVALRPDLMATKIWSKIKNFSHFLFARKLNYKVVYYLATNPNIFDYNGLKLSNGIVIDDQYYQQLKQKYKFADIDDLNKNSKVFLESNQ